MKLLPLRDLVVRKPHPQTTLEIQNAFSDRAQETVETYIFTESIRQHFEQILETVKQGYGQGFWVQAEYGAGKTHFLATLAALLANNTEALWGKVSDTDVRQFQRHLKKARLFTVVCSLLGEASSDPANPRTLLDVILEKGFVPALARAGLGEQIRLTSADELMHWFDQQVSPTFKSDFEKYVQRATGLPLAKRRANEGDESVADLLALCLKESGLKLDIAVSVKDRLASICRQITAKNGPGYTGLLVIIDEYERWANIRSNNTQARAEDEDLLETLGYLIPKDLGMGVHTIVASQSAVPAKLQSGPTGGRFIHLPLLADQNERDYDIIASRRIRDLDRNRAPEINDYYRSYAESFEFARQLKETEFRDIFPFQPRCFEIVRKITSRELPGPRSGIEILYQTINQEELLRRDMLIRASDLMGSQHLVSDCLSKPVYKKHYDAYRMAFEEIPTLELDSKELELARNILSTLFLWHEAYLERPRAMSLKDLTQATLTTGDVLKAEDNVAYVLSHMQSLQQVRFENNMAQFEPVGSEGPSPNTLLREFVRRAQTDPHSARTALTDSLFFTTDYTRSTPGMFQGFESNKPVTRAFDYRNLSYQGEVIIGTRWQPDWGMPITADDMHFRVVILTPDAAESIKASELQDPRIAVVFPASPTDDVLRAATEYVAWSRMNDDYKDQTGKDAEMVRTWLLEQKGTYIGNLLQTQASLYKNGKVLTANDLSIPAKEVFAVPSNEKRVSYIVDKLLSAAYHKLPLDADKLRNTLTATEAGKLFEGYFAKDPAKAQVDATRNYGIGLGLAHPETFARFAPQEGNQALALIAAMLAEKQGNAIQIWRLRQDLASPPYGLPYVVTQLYLLAFVRQNNPRVELTLKRDHKIRLRDGKPFAHDRITAASVPLIQWRPGMIDGFNELVPSAGPDWSKDVLPYARELVDDLHVTTEQAEIEAQSQRLNNRLVALGEDIVRQRKTLGVLERTLDAPVPEEAQQAFTNLENLTQNRNGFESFFEKSQELFRTADGLRDAIRIFDRMRQLAEISSEVIEVKNFLARLQLRDCDRQLSGQKMALLGQMTMGALAIQPHLWSGIRANFDQFKLRYRNEYQKHHRDTNAALKQLGDSLHEAPRQLHALALLNSIRELGPARGERLADDFTQLQTRLKPCAVSDYQQVSVDKVVCSECQRDLTYTPPTVEVETFRRKLENALTDQQRQLSREAILRVLKRGNGDALSQFIQAAQAANVATLVDVLDEDIVKVIRQLLAEEQIGTAEGPVIERFLRQYSSLEESDIPAAIKAFESLLHEAFAEAKKANKDKKTIRLTLK